DANPTDISKGRGSSDSCRGRFPDFRFAHTAQSLFACFTLRSGLSHQRLLISDSDQFDRWTAALLIWLKRIGPANGQRRVELKALFGRIFIADLSQSRTFLFPAPGRLGAVFDQQVDARLMEPFHRQFAMSGLKLVRHDFRIGKELVGRFYLIPVPEDLRDALAGIGRKARRSRDCPLITLGVTQ